MELRNCERVLSSSNRAAPRSFLGEVKKRGGKGNTISLLMEEKFLQIEPVNYLQLHFLSNRGRLGQEGEVRRPEWRRSDIPFFFFAIVWFILGVTVWLSRINQSIQGVNLILVFECIMSRQITRKLQSKTMLLLKGETHTHFCSYKWKVEFISNEMHRSSVKHTQGWQ